MKPTSYARFRRTVEAALGQPQPSPFSSLISGQINQRSILECLNDWQSSSKHADELLKPVSTWLQHNVNAEQIEDDQQIPENYLNGLFNLGCMRARIPKLYGGLGVSQCTFSCLLELLGSHSEVLALVVSVQQLGVAQGLLSQQKLETEQTAVQGEQLRIKYLKHLSDHGIGAFCLTTPETGSDPSCLQTVARLSEDGSVYELSGNRQSGGKLYTTLGTIADVFMMLAVVLYPGESLDDIEPRQRITAFIVDRELPGIHTKALDFCGWHGLPNAAIELDHVRVPVGNQVGNIGDGLKIAFMNLGSGRINIAAISLGMMKQLLRISRWWGLERVQGGKPIALHELNTKQLVKMNASIYAVDSFFQCVSALADKDNADIRLEAAMLKLFASHTLIQTADETLQLRGGRGYESYRSQLRRGETAIPVERLYRSARMMKIGEGGSNILKLYIMRCLLDDLLQTSRQLADKKTSGWHKITLCGAWVFNVFLSYFYAVSTPELTIPDRLHKHFKHLDRQQRRFKRLIYSKIIGEYSYYAFESVNRCLNGRSHETLLKPDQGFEQRQVLLGHCADIATLLAVMHATCLRACCPNQHGHIELADEFCNQAMESIDIHYLQIKHHYRQREDSIHQLGLNILDGQFAELLEQLILGIDLPGIKYHQH